MNDKITPKVFKIYLNTFNHIFGPFLGDEWYQHFLSQQQKKEEEIFLPYEDVEKTPNYFLNDELSWLKINNSEYNWEEVFEFFIKEIKNSHHIIRNILDGKDLDVDINNFNKVYF